MDNLFTVGVDDTEKAFGLLGDRGAGVLEKFLLMGRADLASCQLAGLDGV